MPCEKVEKGQISTLFPYKDPVLLFRNMVHAFLLFYFLPLISIANYPTVVFFFWIQRSINSFIPSHFCHLHLRYIRL
jgi:hypothetical protein